MKDFHQSTVEHFLDLDTVSRPCQGKCILDNSGTFCLICGASLLETVAYNSLDNISKRILRLGALQRLDYYMEIMGYYDN